MDNSISFKGAFLIKQPTYAFREAIKPVLGKKKQIIENINKNGDVLYVVRDTADRDVANFLLETPNAKFSYFADLSTKSGFDTEKPADALQKLKEYKGLIISTKNRLLAKIRRPVNVFKSNIRVVQERNLKAMQKITSLDFSDKAFKKNVDVQTGVCTIKTYKRDYRNGKNREHTLLTITPPGKYGICYAQYIPVSEEQVTRRVALKNGEKIFEYPTSESSKYIDLFANKNKPSVKDDFMQNANDAKEFYKMQLAKRN